MSLLSWTAPDPLVPGTPMLGVYVQELQHNCAEKRKEANLGIPSWLNASAGQKIRLEWFEEIKRVLEDPLLLQYYGYPNIKSILGHDWTAYSENVKTHQKLWSAKPLDDMRRVIDALFGAIYLDVDISPAYVEKDAGNPDQTDPFDIYIEAWNRGKGGNVPAGGINKLEGTQSYRVIANEPELEVCFTNQTIEATQNIVFNGTVDISTLFSDISGISLYKSGWDGTVTITNGAGNVTGVVYKTDGGGDLDDAGQILVEGRGAE